MRIKNWLSDLFTPAPRSRRRTRKSWNYPVAAEVLEDRTLLTTFTVTGLEDTIADDGVLTLPEALREANNPGADIIEFDPSLNGGTIELGIFLPFISGVTDDLIIRGPGSGLLTIDGLGSNRIFTVQTQAAVEISGLTLTGGRASSLGAGAIEHSRFAGSLTLADVVVTGNTGRAISSPGDLTIVDSRITDNSGGAALGVSGDLTIVDSELSGNSTEFGVSTLGFSGGIATIVSSTISNNSGSTTIVNGGTMLISNSTLNGNSTAGLGGAVHNARNLTITNSTLSGNSSLRNGGALFNRGTLTVVGSTVVGNRSSAAGGFFGGGGIATNNFTGHTTTLHNSIIAGNFRGGGTIPNDLGGKAVEGISSHNLIGDATFSGGLTNGVNGNIVGVNVAAVLDTNLADNGGPTLTHALIDGSLAIDAGDNSRIPAGVTADQRGTGFPRIVNGTVDIGAFELGLTNTPPDANDDPSQANDIHYFSSEDSPISVAAAFGLLANDSDPDAGDTIHVTSNTATTKGGIVNVNGDGGFAYDPNDKFENLAVGEFSMDTFDYTITDDAGAADTATVTITIVGENDDPTVASAVAVTSHEDAAAFSVDLLDGASDVDTSDSLNVASLMLIDGDDAGVTVNGNNLDVDASKYNHLAAGETEVITYSYDVIDGNGGSVAQTATITIEGRNDAPAGADFTRTGTEDSPLALSATDFTAHFSDPDTSDSLKEIRIDSLSTDGTLKLNGAAVTAGQVIDADDLDNLVFVPNLNFNGETTFTWSAGDGIAFDSTPATVTLDILSAAEQADVIFGKIQALLDAGIINEGQAESLTFMLKDNLGDAGQVQAFLNEVQGYIGGGILTEEQADDLLVCGGLLLHTLTTG